jgi:hypothetical protein
MVPLLILVTPDIGDLELQQDRRIDLVEEVDLRLELPIRQIAGRAVMDDMEVDRNDRVGVELDMVGAEGGADALGSPDVIKAGQWRPASSASLYEGLAASILLAANRDRAAFRGKGSTDPCHRRRQACANRTCHEFAPVHCRRSSVAFRPTYFGRAKADR